MLGAQGTGVEPGHQVAESRDDRDPLPSEQLEARTRSQQPDTAKLAKGGAAGSRAVHAEDVVDQVLGQGAELDDRSEQRYGPGAQGRQNVGLEPGRGAGTRSGQRVGQVLDLPSGQLVSGKVHQGRPPTGEVMYAAGRLRVADAVLLDEQAPDRMRGHGEVLRTALEHLASEQAATFRVQRFAGGDGH